MAFVNSAGNSVSTSGSYISTSSAINITTGNTVIVGVANYTTGGVVVSSVTDTVGNTYVRAGNAEGFDANSDMEVWYAENVAGNPSNVVRANFASNATNRRLLVLQYSGLASAGVYNVSGELSLSPVGTTHETSTVTTTVISELCIAFFINTGEATGGYTGVSPSVKRYGCTTNDAALVEEVQATEGTCSIIASTVSAAQTASIVRTFKSRNYLLSLGSGSYSIVGSTAGTLYIPTVTADPGSYAITGSEATFSLTYNILEALPGSLTTSGTVIEFVFTKLVDAEPGTLAISEGEPSFTYEKLLVLDSGSYLVEDDELGLVKIGAASAFMQTLTAKSKSFSLYAKY